MPGRPVVTAVRRSGTRRARIDLDDFAFVRFAYLDPGPAATGTLRVYPADTLYQARVFYGDPQLVDRTLELEMQGWDVRPNFHFGAMVRGVCWTKSAISPREYADYWVEHISSTKGIPRGEWDVAIEHLVESGIFDGNDRSSFERHFVTTRRQVATPRPGLLLERRLPLTPSTGFDPVETLRREIRALEAVFRGDDSDAPGEAT